MTRASFRQKVTPHTAIQPTEPTEPRDPKYPATELRPVTNRSQRQQRENIRKCCGLASCTIVASFGFFTLTYSPRHRPRLCLSGILTAPPIDFVVHRPLLYSTVNSAVHPHPHTRWRSHRFHATLSSSPSSRRARREWERVSDPYSLMISFGMDSTDGRQALALMASRTPRIF